MSSSFDDDVLDDDAPGGPDYPWFQRPAPSANVTFALAGILLVWTGIQFQQRVQRLKQKFGDARFTGSLRCSAYISAYVDNEDPTFAIARLCAKSLVFLGLMQINFHRGFWIMLGLLVLESSLDTIRILLAYCSCHSLRQLRATSEDEAKDIQDVTQLEPTNVYEDLARPKSIAGMVFVVQTSLIGIVMYDTYSTTTRSCFNGTEGCLMLESLGSYCLYFMGTFMACVFYVGPMNSFGKKEHDPVFWLKLFLMTKQSGSAVLSWKDPNTEQTKTLPLTRNGVRIWAQFFMSWIVNSICFHFLLHALPIQIASKSSIMGVVFSSVGMIYLVDLDDSTGNTLTLVSDGHPTSSDAPPANGYDSLAHAASNDTDLEAVKQRLLEEAIQDIKAKLEIALADGVASSSSSPSAKSGHSSMRLENITHALFMAARGKHEESNQQTPRNIRESSPLMSA